MNRLSTCKSINRNKGTTLGGFESNEKIAAFCQCNKCKKNEKKNNNLLLVGKLVATYAVDILHVLERMTGGAVVWRGKIGGIVVQHHIAALRMHETHGHVWGWLPGPHPHHAHLCDTRHCIHYNTTLTVNNHKETDTQLATQKPPPPPARQINVCMHSAKKCSRIITINYF